MVCFRLERDREIEQIPGEMRVVREEMEGAEGCDCRSGVGSGRGGGGREEERERELDSLDRAETDGW